MASFLYYIIFDPTESTESPLCTIDEEVEHVATEALLYLSVSDRALVREPETGVPINTI